MSELFLLLIRLLFFMETIINCVDAAPFAQSDLTINSNAPIGNGVWDISASCQMVTNVAFNPGEAYLLFRSGVPYTLTTDNANGAVVQSGSKWHVVQIGYGSGGSFMYTVQYRHTRWLAGAHPSGECDMYIGSTDAVTDATNGYELEDPAADPHISSEGLVQTAYNHPTVDAGCSFLFSGISFGTNEAVVIIDYKVPIQNLNDYNGGGVVFISDDKTWSICAVPTGAQNSYQFNVRFDLVTTNSSWSAAECHMYTVASTAHLNSGSSLSSFLFPTSTSSTSTPTGTSATPPMSATSSPPMLPTMSATSFLPGLPLIFTISTPTPGQNVNGEVKLSEVLDMRNQFVDSGNLWQRITTNVLRCARQCRVDPACYSVFFEANISRCTAHGAFKSSGIASTNVRYFVKIQ